MSVKKSVVYFLKQGSNFAGRSSRSEYRSIKIFQFAPAISILLLAFGADYLDMEGLIGFIQFLSFWVFLLWWIALILPAMAVTVRRFHDLNMRGWWTIVPNGLVFWSAFSFYAYAWVATPEGLMQARLAGAGYLVVVLALMFKTGTTGANRFGLDTSTEHAAQVKEDRRTDG